MSTRRSFSAVAMTSLIFACACASTADEPVTAANQAPTPEVMEEIAPAPGQDQADEPVEVEVAKELPTACAADGKICTPPLSFTKRLCKKTTPTLAMQLFHKSSPWTRAYVRADMEAWYASGSRSRPRKLKYAEEVIIVADRSASDTGVQVSGSGSYDVYRFDGTCVSLMSGEVSLRRPATPDVATVRWKRLDAPLKSKLRENRKIAFRYAKRNEACKTDSKRRCDRAEVSLSRMIADYVRRGGEIPEPTKLP